MLPLLFTAVDTDKNKQEYEASQSFTVGSRQAHKERARIDLLHARSCRPVVPRSTVALTALPLTLTHSSQFLTLSLSCASCVCHHSHYQTHHHEW